MLGVIWVNKNQEWKISRTWLIYNVFTKMSCNNMYYPNFQPFWSSYEVRSWLG